MKKKISVLLLSLTLITSGINVLADTVYYQGTPVYWNYGRRWVVWSFSEVQSHIYEHCATANSSFSGWFLPGAVALAEEYIGSNRADCYWNCR